MGESTERWTAHRGHGNCGGASKKHVNGGPLRANDRKEASERTVVQELARTDDGEDENTLGRPESARRARVMLGYARAVVDLKGCDAIYRRQTLHLLSVLPLALALTIPSRERLANSAARGDCRCRRRAPK